ASVILYGESGTGKELAAARIHAESRRAEGPFVAVNCGAIPDGLFEAEMFGAERGAYTGATEARPGFFLRAHRGTLFLDEVAGPSPPARTRPRRVLGRGRVVRLGAKRDEPADVRIVAASHRNLRDEVKRGAFREDLCFRLDVVEVRVPPLRERADDYALL